MHGETKKKKLYIYMNRGDYAIYMRDEKDGGRLYIYI